MSTYSPNLRLELINTGDQAGTWGNTTNTNLGTLLESAVSGYTSVLVTSANQALTALNGAEDQARNLILALSTSTTANFNVYAPPAEKSYVIHNTSAYSATLYNSTVLGNTTAAGTGVTIPAGRIMAVWSDGTNFRSQITHLPALTLTVPLAVADGGTGGTTSASARANLGLVIGTDIPGPTGLGASGTWGINVSGNAGTVTNGVYTTGDQTIAGTKTFSSTIAGSINGNAATVTNGFYTTSSFFIGTTSLAVNRASGSQTLTGVSIDGNAATATAATSAVSATTATNLSGGSVSATTGAFSGILTANAGVREKQVAVGASNIDLSAGSYFSKTITGTTTFTVSNVAASGNAASFVLDLTNGGAFTVNWWSGVKWPAGYAPTLTTAGRDVLGFFTYDGGTTWTGLVLGKDVK